MVKSCTSCTGVARTPAALARMLARRMRLAGLWARNSAAANAWERQARCRSGPTYERGSATTRQWKQFEPAVRATEIEMQCGEQVIGRATEVVGEHFEIAVRRRLTAVNGAAASRNPGDI